MIGREAIYILYPRLQAPVKCTIYIEINKLEVMKPSVYV